jgi:hypothetical protein
MKPMTDEMFAMSTRFKHAAPVEEFVAALDAARYWGAASLTVAEKRAHVLAKLESITNETDADAEDIVEWIEDTYPNARDGLLSSEELVEVSAHAYLKQWHPERLSEALDTVLGEAAQERK